MKRLYNIGRLWVVLILAGAWTAAAQEVPDGVDASFSVSAINTSLTPDVPALVRLNRMQFEVKGPGEAVKRVHRAVTVLEPEGRDRGELVLYYDRRRQIERLEGVLRTADGRVIRRLEGSDQEDYSAISGFSLYEDTRVRLARLYHDEYPYTVEFTYEVHYDGLVTWPRWYPQLSGDPVEHARFEVSAPLDIEVRYKMQGMDIQPTARRGKNRQVLRWVLQDLPGRTLEPMGPPEVDQMKAVHTAPDRFEVEGSSGDMSSWSAYGRWYHELGQGRRQLPEQAVKKVRALTADAASEREKVKRLYRFMQEKTRYVSVQLGLGGWQPYDATYVHERGYGDCKALVNYMQALLEAAGIASYPALIHSGVQAPRVHADFPSNQFNHVILNVPLESDTLWLEATSSTIPFGHIGAANEGRHALVVRPQDSELVRTPLSTAEENRRVRRGRIDVTASGTADAELTTTYAGNEQDRLRHLLTGRQTPDDEAWVHELYDASSIRLRRFDPAEVVTRGKSMTVTMALSLPQYASLTGKRLFLPLNVERFTDVPPDVEERTEPLHLPYAFTEADTLRYLLPPGYRVEAAPDSVALETPFGRYEAEVEAAGDTLVYRRRLVIRKTRIAPEKYEAYRRFARRAARSDRAQAVLVRR